MLARAALFLVALVASCAVLAAAQPPVPEMPQLFTADVQVKNNMLPMTLKGKMTYDYPSQKQRIDFSGLFGGTELDRYDQMIQYDIAGGQCKCKQLNDTMPSYTIAPGSEFVGFQQINGVNCSGWLFQFPGIFYLTVWADAAKSVPVEANVTMVSQGPWGNIVTLMSFANVAPQTSIDSSVFDPPASCASACPAPPSPTPSGSCPNDPAPGCSCVSASLSFCSAVDYPLPSAIIGTDPAGMDSFVESAYLMMTGPMSGANQTCLDNIKAYLCAFYFPECTTDGISFLPCPSLCPTCGCGANPTAACPALSPSAPCTMYGATSYCS